jgi:hypothetical protein
VQIAPTLLCYKLARQLIGSLFALRRDVDEVAPLLVVLVEVVDARDEITLVNGNVVVSSMVV